MTDQRVKFRSMTPFQRAATVAGLAIGSTVVALTAAIVVGLLAVAARTVWGWVL